MNEQSLLGGTRREFIKTGGQVAAASVLAGITLPHVLGAADTPLKSEGLQIALVGAGGRGTGAASNALSVSGPPIKLVAMADVSEKKMEGSYNGLSKKHGDKVEVPPDRRYIGFDAAMKAMDHLRPGDVAIFATPCAFRGVHFKYAMDKGLNVFMEKPVAPDGPSARRLYALAEESLTKPIKVAVGLMCRHSAARVELLKRIKDGQIGDPISYRCYREQGVVASCFSDPKPEGMNELEWQISRFHSFLWLSGGSFSDYMIHNIDECCMMHEKFPIKAAATGGRHYREGHVDQNFDHYNVEYTFDDGIKQHMSQRNMPGCKSEFASYVHGTKGMAVISSAAHTPAKAKIFKGHNMKSEDVVWAMPQPETDPYQVEWDDFITAIRQNTPYNELKRGIDASLTCVMGRMAAHTGQEITWDDALNCDHDMAPNVGELKLGGESPLKADAKGLYPVPEPGVKKKREY